MSDAGARPISRPCSSSCARRPPQDPTPATRVVRLSGERTTLRELLRERAGLPQGGAGGFTAAVEAFERGRLLVVIDGRQRMSLDEAVELSPASDVAFIRLVPLAGG